MSFTSILFLFYFLPITVAAYFLLGLLKRGPRAQNICLLIASLVFYFWLEPAFLPFLLLSILFNFLLGRGLKRAIWEGQPTRRFAVLTYAVNGGFFLLLQLLASFVRNGWPILGLEQGVLRGFTLPVGAGIITLRAIGYVIDIYHKKIDAEVSPLNFSLYISFFPQLVAGPMTPYEGFRPQLLERPFKRDMFHNGVCRFVVGLGKKILLANNLAVVADEVFLLSSTSDSLTEAPVTLAWLGLLAFALQIYYDFSAYTDMAVGLGNIFGFSAPENFRYPYLARSVNDFWTRWNITITDWFDRYVSRPLDRKRSVNKDQLVVNTFLAFLTMGMWYKTSIGIVIWALLQVFFMTVENVITYDKRKIPRVFQHLYLVVVVAFSWALFRTGNLYQVLLFLRNLLGMNQNGFLSPLALTFLKEYWIFFVAGLLFLFPIAPFLHKKVNKAKGKGIAAVATVAYPVLLLGVFFLSILYLSRGLYAPYAYFSF